MSNEVENELKRQIAKLRDDANALERDGGDLVLIELKRDRAVGLEHTLALTELRDTIEPIRRARESWTKFFSKLFWISIPIAIAALMAALFKVKL